MGEDISQDKFSQQDFDRFNQKLRHNLQALKQVLAFPGFGVGEDSLGAELEFYLIDQQGAPAPCNQLVLDHAKNPQLTPELNQFNIEYNLLPQLLKGSPFLAFEQELRRAIAGTNSIASQFQAELIAIGILPTLIPDQFGHHNMTDQPRYRAMDNALRKLRGGPFNIDIDGKPPLNLQWDDVTLEGATTSFQLHWKLNPDQFTNAFNAIQLVTPIALALAANSPTLFGHELWDETRIALFKQSIDCRNTGENRPKYPPRVYFGNGWIQQGPLELFASTVALFPAIMSELSEKDPLKCVEVGKLPQLHELKIHQGSTWPWNRAIYDQQNEGHVRIEARALPAGPTLQDMSANAAFLLGCALALRDSMPSRINIMPFKYAEDNFYRAAQYSLNAKLLWPSSSQVKVIEYPMLELAQLLLPLATDALLEAGLDETECSRLMGIIADRIQLRLNGAFWQKSQTRLLLEKGSSPTEAFNLMLNQYRNQFYSEKPLSQWEYLK